MEQYCYGKCRNERWLLFIDHRRQFSDSQNQACSTFILIVLLLYNNIHPTLPFPSIEHRDSAVAHSS